jgi:hypothetical protein
MSGLIDNSINFGLQNWIVVRRDTTDGTYDYTGFQNKKGTVLIMRSDKAFENVLYYSSNGDFDTIWANRKGTGSYTYVTPKDIVIPSL